MLKHFVLVVLVACGGGKAPAAQAPASTSTTATVLILDDAMVTGAAPAMQREELVLMRDGKVLLNGQHHATLMANGEVRDATGRVFMTIGADGKVMVAGDKDNHFRYEIREDGTVLADGNVNLAFGDGGVLTGSDVAPQTGGPPQRWSYVGSAQVRRAVALAWIAKRMGFRDPFRSKSDS